MTDARKALFDWGMGTMALSPKELQRAVGEVLVELDLRTESVKKQTGHYLELEAELDATVKQRNALQEQLHALLENKK